MPQIGALKGQGNFREFEKATGQIFILHCKDTKGSL